MVELEKHGPKRFRPGRFDANVEDSVANIGKGPKGYRRSDSRIRDEVCQVLTYSAVIDPIDVEVHVSEGIVTLEGSVRNKRDKRHAEDLIEDLPGIEAVHNHLWVRRKTLGWIPLDLKKLMMMNRNH